MPDPDGNWDEICRYAHTFNGYTHFGERWAERAAEIRDRFGATGELTDDPDDLRAALVARESWIEQHNALSEDASRELQIVGASSMEQWDRTAAERTDEIEGVWIPRENALAIGDALHRTMEIMDLATGEDLEPIARAMCAESGISDHLDEVIEMARNCLASAIVKRAVASGNYWREASFTVPRADGGFDVGRVDLVFNEGDGLVVVDYKTDRVTTEEGLIAAHSTQAYAYVQGLQSASGEVVRECHFVFARQEPRTHLATIEFAV